MCEHLKSFKEISKNKYIQCNKSKVLNNNQTPFVMGCPSHMLQASKAKTKIGSICNFDVEDYCVNLLYWFKHRKKNRCEEVLLVLVKNFASFVMSSTGRLSLETAVKRALKPYNPLKSYFLLLDQPQVRFKRLKKHLKIP